MISQPNLTPKIDWQVVLDIATLSLGILIGALGALIGVWLWFDYQIDPASSVLATISSQLAAILPPTTQQFMSQQTQFMGLPLSGSTAASFEASFTSSASTFVSIFSSFAGASSF